MGTLPAGLVERELQAVEVLIAESLRSEEPLLTEIAQYVVGAGGKRVRPLLTLLAFRAVGGKDPQPAVRIAAALELLHSATLLHDDINDRGVTRRGRLAAFRKYGALNALVTGDFLFVKAFAIGGKFAPEIVDLTAAVATSLAEGEILQRRLNNDVQISPMQYLDVVRRKTAMPLSLGARLGAYLGGARDSRLEHLARYGLNVGIAFQIMDDILDVVGDEAVLGKRVGSDVWEGNVTLPAIHALNDGATIDPALLARLLRKKRKTDAEVRRALSMIQDSGAVEKARADAGRYASEAKGALDTFPTGTHRDALLALADFVVSRQR